ncbi:MAG: GTP cyclohydrolase II, partial [Alphaproteobacteria bacterium]|nr:GTP cyclohydrolase II [Alphaproteobacteria bacterium]
MAPPFAGLGPVAGGGRARAVAELRRGLPVVLADGTVAAIVAAAEAAEPEAAERLHALMGTPARLVLTARRARALHLRETGEEAVAVALPERLDPTLIHALADPTRDLENPLRGPFAVVSDVPQTLAAGAVQLCKAARLLPAALVAV